MTADKNPARPAGERIAKLLARAGVASRRDVERLIAAGRIAVDGAVISTPATFVSAASRITLDGKPVAAPEPTRLWLYHKPRGLVTTARDPQARPTVFEKLPSHLPRVISIGRLDLDSEGLLLLTNDGALARRLELPSSGWPRTYRVRVRGCPSAATLARLRHGITIRGIHYGPIEARLDSANAPRASAHHPASAIRLSEPKRDHARSANTWLTVTLREGKNREVRRVFAHLGHPVSRLIRIAFGPFELASLPPGAVEEVSPRISPLKL
jgi:23S rRNA pseudouridine2605 synthase